MGSGVDSEIGALLLLKGRPGLGDRGIARLVARHGSGLAALKAVQAQRELLPMGGGPPRPDHWVGQGIQPVPMTASAYPSRLHELTDPPPVLFVKGKIELLHRPSVAVVGARRATETGRTVAETLGRVLGEAGITVVSGMARGIDGAAHRGALSAGGDTLAVLGSGLEVVYPRIHRALFRKVGERGLLVSEFLPEEPALPHHFPKRNRIIAALASAIIVVEAGERSGALITVDHGLDLGRDILAIPGSPFSPQSRGTNALIRDGARLIPDPEAVLGQIPEVVRAAASGARGGSPGGPMSPSGPADPAAGNHLLPDGLRPLWESLEPAPLGAESIAGRAGLSLGDALAGLSALELMGMARRCSGMRFRRG